MYLLYEHLTVLITADKMIKPDDFDNTEEEKDVDENGEDGGHREKVDTVALVHPAKFVLINHSAI